MASQEHIDAYFESIVEREVIFIRKELLKLPREQWTDVEVYKKYRFCNVHRCYDKTFKLIKRLSDELGGIHSGLRTVLRWLASNQLLEYLINGVHYPFYDPELYNAMFDANEGSPEALFNIILKDYHDGIVPLVSGSFIVKRYGNDLEQMLWLYSRGTEFNDKFVTPYTTEGKTFTSEDAVQFFRSHRYYVNWFSAYCIISDWIYLLPDMFTDLYTWTAYGPGAYNGIQLLAGSISKKQYLPCLQALWEEWNHRAPEMFDDVLKQTGLTRDRLNELCVENHYYPMEDLLLTPPMLDVEHWLCEYAKYARGWAKKKYV